MVDQGQKGYCVVATAARIFAYYGMDYVDQHELASLANTSADGGTNTAAMAENLKKNRDALPDTDQSAGFPDEFP